MNKKLNDLHNNREVPLTNRMDSVKYAYRLEEQDGVVDFRKIKDNLGLCE